MNPRKAFDNNDQPPKRRQGRPRIEVTEYPETFPEQTGIKSYDDLFDTQTEEIIKTAGKWLFDTGMFNSDFEDMEQEIRMRLPAEVQKFNAFSKNNRSRYHFIKHVVHRIGVSLYKRRITDLKYDQTISLDTAMDENGDFTLENEIDVEDQTSKARRQYEVLEILSIILPRLSARDQEIAFMRAFLDMSYGEIAKRLGVVKNEVFYRMTVAIPAKVYSMKEV